MVHVPSVDFIDRVVTSQERISFSFVDPYGHLSTCRYLEIFVNHRMSAPEEQQGMATLELVKHGMGLFIASTSVNYLRQTLLGEVVEISSWVQSLHSSGFEIFGVMYGTENRRARATFHLMLRSVDLKTGKPTALPASVPCTSDQLLAKLPLREDFLKTLQGIHKDSFKVADLS